MGSEAGLGAGEAVDDGQQGPPQPGRQDGESAELTTMLVLQMTAALVANPPTELTIINVADEAGTVTLSGQVSNSAVRAMAERIAAEYPGVSQTVNEIEVVPPDGPSRGGK
jgi:osmotically-inducible protein OsmY